jgi:hypothetical protein
LGVRLSPWHYLAAALIALVGTGAIAVLDRSGNGNGGQAAAPNGKGEALQLAKAVESPAKAPVVEPARNAIAATQSSTRAPAPAASAPAAPAASAAKNAPSAPRSLFAETPELPESSPPPAVPEGPAATTASLAPPAPPPARQAAAPAPQPVAAPASPAPAAPQTGTAALQAAAARRSVAVNANAPVECLPDEIRALLAEIGTRFGPITVVSTHKHLTGNHSTGSVREKHHLDCRAVDFKPDRHRVEAIKTYLRGRAEVGSVDSYRSGVVHIDFSASRSAGRAAAPARAAAAAASAPALLEAPAEAPAPAPADESSNPFAPRLPPWQR